MSFTPLHLSSITFKGPEREAQIDFIEGVNVICGASDTGKSFLAEAIDFMLGGSTLKELPEREPYASASLAFIAKPDRRFTVTRALSGGNFQLVSLDSSGAVRPPRSSSSMLKGEPTIFRVTFSTQLV